MNSTMRYMDEVDAIDVAVKEAAPAAVGRYRAAGVLTWALMYRIEEEILKELAATGRFSKWALQMIRAADVMGYPKDDRPVSFCNAGIVLIIFSEIDKAWRRVH